NSSFVSFVDDGSHDDADQQTDGNFLLQHGNQQSQAKSNN
ncbi:MAG: hypothetical protein RLZZ45_1738, partial [Bacteroidota bacterium]